MKSLKLSVLAASLALVAGAAQAQIADGTQGANAEMFLSVYDATTQMSFVKDLGITVGSFQPTSGAAAANTSFNLAGDAKWTAFTNAVAAAGSNLGNSVYNVVGASTVGSTAGSTYYVFTTSNATAAQLGTTYNTKVLSWGGATNNYIGAVNGLDGMGGLTFNYALNGSATATAADNSAYYNGGVFGDNFGNNMASLTNSANVGTSLNFYKVRASSTSALGRASVTQFGLAGQPAATWTLANNGTLTYAVAPVPEPGSWAMMLAGLLAVGAIARRRLS